MESEDSLVPMSLNAQFLDVADCGTRLSANVYSPLFVHTRSTHVPYSSVKLNVSPMLDGDAKQLLQRYRSLLESVSVKTPGSVRKTPRKISTNVTQLLSDISLIAQTPTRLSIRPRNNARPTVLFTEEAASKPLQQSPASVADFEILTSIPEFPSLIDEEVSNILEKCTKVDMQMLRRSRTLVATSRKPLLQKSISKLATPKKRTTQTSSNKTLDSYHELLENIDNIANKQLLSNCEDILSDIDAMVEKRAYKHTSSRKMVV